MPTLDLPPAPAPHRALHLRFLDLALDPLQGLNVRVTVGGVAQTWVTDAEGQLEALRATPGVRLRIELARFDGSHKLLEDAAMPATEASWTYISPQLVLEAETVLHAGEPGQIERSIPVATPADEGPPSTEGPTDAPARAPTGDPIPGAAGPADTAGAADAAGPRAAPLTPGAPATPIIKAPAATAATTATTAATAAAGAAAPAPARPPQPAAPLAAPAPPAPPAPRPGAGTRATTSQPTPARQSPQVLGRTAQGTPMAVFALRLRDWWQRWTLPSLNPWAHPFAGGPAPTAPAPGAASAQGRGSRAQRSKVPYDPRMLPRVQALIQFAQAQTEFAYGPGEGTAAVLAQMARGQFRHVPGEKRTQDAMGRCYQYVRIALTRAGIVTGFLADTAPASVQASARLAGQPLLDKGFVDVTDEVPDARWAATGDVIVYAWSEATWAERKKGLHANTPNHGHIDIRSETSYISDFMPTAKHPKWTTRVPQSPTGFEPTYVDVRIYRKDHDPRPTCRIRAFLACLRVYEAQAIPHDADRYRALNTPLPDHPRQPFFTGYAHHPWRGVSRATLHKDASTAAGAYQCTLGTTEGCIQQRMLHDLEGRELFSPAAQDRLAVILMEEKRALPAIRQGDLEAAVKALTGTWASLPGAAQNHGRRTADGRPMDMAHLRRLYAGFLADELRQHGIVE